MAATTGCARVHQDIAKDGGAQVASTYEVLADVYDWLVPDAKTTPSGSAAAYADVVASAPTGGRVLDCSCGTGTLAVGLVGLGLEVVASDASPQMVQRTEDLSAAHGHPLTALVARWDELPQRLPAATFDLVFCIGNSLGHAEGEAARLSALSSMKQMLGPTGRLVLASRNWEKVRALGTRTEVSGRVIRRRGQDAVVVYSWRLAERWEDEHHLEISVAVLEPDGAVRTQTEVLSLWPFRHQELLAQLHSLGLRVEEDSFDADGDNYRIIASRAPAE